MTVENETQPPADPRRPGIFKDWRIWMPRAAFEAALIVFSLLGALALSNWQEQRRLDRDVAEIRAALIAEVQANRDMLTSPRLLPHHRQLQGGLQEALFSDSGQQDLRASALPLFETGIHFPATRDAVWRTAADSGVLQHMDRREVFALADAYAAQDNLRATNSAYYPLALLLPGQIEDPDAVRGALMGTMLFMGDLIGGEQMIIRLQTEALIVLDAEEAGDFQPPV